MSRSHSWRLGILLLLLVVALVTRQHWRRDAPGGGTSTPANPAKTGGALTEGQAQAFFGLENQEREANASIWRTELEAQRHEDVFHDLWNSLNVAKDPFAILRDFNLGELRVGATNKVTDLSHGIRKVEFANATTNTESAFLSAETWRSGLEALHNAGWRLGRTRWNETAFRASDSSRPTTSTIEFTGEVTNPVLSVRAMIKGELDVIWKRRENEISAPVPHTAVTRNLEWLDRSGGPVFQETFHIELGSRARGGFVDPLWLHDLQGDGFSEIILVGANTVFWNEGGHFRPEPLIRTGLPEGRALAAVGADLNRDGREDLLLAATGGLCLFVNDGSGRFPGSGQWLWKAPDKLRHPQTIAAGDIDGDGDVDLWVAQYKLPYQGGQFPTPYFDANDGFPSFLLRNDGDAGFTDVTQESGLAAKRWRRTYSASFVDLDLDGKLDLVNVSDFAGLDFYRNEGNCRFTDRTSGLGDARHLFGMAHAVADMNADEHLDLLVMGMDSPVASRLDALGLARPGFIGDPVKRRAMTYGNRLFLGGANGFEMAPFASRLARAGWAWGVSVFDFNNDRRLDVAVANGHETASNVKDYERQFWLHDLFVAGSTNNPVANMYFGSAYARRVAEGASYGGWHSQALFIDCGKFDYADVAFVLGATIPEDAQNLATDDVDGDGRLDLVFTTFSKWPERKPSLRILRNTLTDAGHWIGLRLDASKSSWLGARARLQTSAGVQTRWLLAGDSYRTQHAPAAHFGLGELNSIESLEVLWADGRRTKLKSPEIGRWNRLPDQ